MGGHGVEASAEALYSERCAVSTSELVDPEADSGGADKTSHVRRRHEPPTVRDQPAMVRDDAPETVRERPAYEPKPTQQEGAPLPFAQTAPVAGEASAAPPAIYAKTQPLPGTEPEPATFARTAPLPGALPASAFGPSDPVPRTVEMPGAPRRAGPSIGLILTAFVVVTAVSLAIGFSAVWFFVGG